MKTKNLTFCIPKELTEKLEKHYQETMIPKSRLVSKLLEEYFKKQENKFKKIRQLSVWIKQQCFDVNEKRICF